jgi:hypothetical protein
MALAVAFRPFALEITTGGVPPLTSALAVFTIAEQASPVTVDITNLLLFMLFSFSFYCRESI